MVRVEHWVLGVKLPWPFSHEIPGRQDFREGKTEAGYPRYQRITASVRGGFDIQELGEYPPPDAWPRGFWKQTTKSGIGASETILPGGTREIRPHRFSRIVVTG